MEKGDGLEQSIKRENVEGIQVAADYRENRDGPPPGFTHPYCHTPEGPSDANINSRKSNKENSRRYRLLKKAEREDLKRKRDALHNECQSLEDKNGHLKGYIEQTNMKIHELIEDEKYLKAQNYEME